MEYMMLDEVDDMLTNTELSTQEIARLCNTTLSVVHSRCQYTSDGCEPGTTRRIGGFTIPPYDFCLEDCPTYHGATDVS